MIEAFFFMVAKPFMVARPECHWRIPHEANLTHISDFLWAYVG
jgi:hypothetical protein